MVLIGELMYCLKYGCTKCVQPRVDPASGIKLIQVTKSMAIRILRLITLVLCRYNRTDASKKLVLSVPQAKNEAA